MFASIIHCIQYLWYCVSRASRYSTVPDTAQIIQIIADIRNLVSGCAEFCGYFLQLHKFVGDALIKLCEDRKSVVRERV